MSKYASQWIHADTLQSMSSKATTEQLWVWLMTKIVMRSRSTWMHAILDLQKAVGVYSNFLCMLNPPQFIDFLSIWKTSSWFTTMQMTMLMMLWKGVQPRTLLLLLGLKLTRQILRQGRQPIRTFLRLGFITRETRFGGQDRRERQLVTCTLHLHLQEKDSIFGSFLLWFQALLLLIYAQSTT